MAIEFVSKAAKGFDASSTTQAIDCTGANLLVVAIVDDAGSRSLNSITYNGVAMTQAAYKSSAPRVYLYYLVNPSQGSNNISVTFSGSDDFGIMAVAYSGVDTANPLGSTNTGVAPNSLVTTTVPNELIVFAAVDAEDTANVRTPGGGMTERHDLLAGSGAGDYGQWFGDVMNLGAGTWAVGYSPNNSSSFALACFKPMPESETFSVTKSLAYNIAEIDTYSITKSLSYRVAIDKAITKGLKYVANRWYGSGFDSTLPTAPSASLLELSDADYSAVAVDDNVYAIQAGTGYIISEFRHWNADRKGFIVTWKGKASDDPATSPVSLQVYRVSTSSWVTLDSNTSALGDVEFTLTATLTADSSDYYDANDFVVFRVYQELN